MRQRIVEKLMHVLFFIAACASVLAVVLICLFLFRNGIPAIGEIGITKFLLGQKWKPSNNLYGILPFILGSIYVTAGSIVVGVPTALLLAVFLAFYCPKKLYPIFKTTVNLMAGVPSVVYGFFANLFRRLEPLFPFPEYKPKLGLYILPATWILYLHF